MRVEVDKSISYQTFDGIGQADKPGAIWILLIFTFINQFITSLGHLLGPSVNADIRDYQHYITGERIDGMFSAVGLIGNAITMVTGLALPAIYERTGLNRETAISLGYDGSVVYEVLNDKDYFIRICSVLIIASAIGAALNVIPYFFYDFTEAKQKAVISVLKIRAMFEDYANNRQDEDIQAEATEIIRKSSELCKKEMWELNGLKGKELSEKRKENGERETAKEYKSILTELKAKKKENDFSIRVANHKYTVYCRAVKPYIDAKRIIAQAECYSKIDEIISI